MTRDNWHLVVCGLSHKTAALQQLEPFSVPGEDLGRANAMLAHLPQVAESLILSTCNRVEFYFVTRADQDPREVVAAFYQEFSGIDVASQHAPLWVKTGADVSRHLFRVAAGLDSMVVGEDQILGQIKDAYSSACAVKATGKVTHRLFHHSFRAGKQVRSDTPMGRGACSVSSAAVEMLAGHMKDFTQPVILFVGVNQMIGLAAGRLQHVPGARLQFANRTEPKAAGLAAKYDGCSFGLQDLMRLVAGAHVVVTCTSAPDPVISRAMLAAAAAQRAEGPGIIMDLAVPRDVEEGANTSDTFTIYRLDDVKRFVGARQHERMLAVPQAEEIVAHRADEFNYWYEHVMHEPMYNGSAPAFESLRREELAAIVDALPPRLQRELNSATRRLVRRIMEAADRGQAHRSE